VSYSPPKFAHWPAHDRGGGGILQCHSTQILLVILLAQGFLEKPKLVLLKLNSSKKSPYTPLDFLKCCWVIIDL
jgi:hypothetical protein